MARHAENDPWCRGSCVCIKISLGLKRTACCLGRWLDLLGSDKDYEADSDSEGRNSKESDDGLQWLDDPPPTTGNVERHVFTIEEMVDVSSSYILDLLDSAPPTVRVQAGPQPAATLSSGSGAATSVPKEKDWSVW